MPRGIIAAVIKSGGGLGGTHPIPKIVVVGRTEGELDTQIRAVQLARIEQATASARQRGDAEPFTLDNFPVLWRGDPDDESLDPQFREWLAFRLAHPVMHRGEAFRSSARILRVPKRLNGDSATRVVSMFRSSARILRVPKLCLMG